MRKVGMLSEGKATGGLVLFYNERASSGILTNNGDILANINGWQFPTEKNVVSNHAFGGFLAVRIGLCSIG